jgi:hypothetical protein
MTRVGSQRHKKKDSSSAEFHGAVPPFIHAPLWDLYLKIVIILPFISLLYFIIYLIAELDMHCALK